MKYILLEKIIYLVIILVLIYNMIKLFIDGSGKNKIRNQFIKSLSIFNCTFEKKIYYRYSKIKVSNKVNYLVNYKYRINRAKSAIFSLAYNYTEKNYHIFFNTLRKTNYSGDIYFLTHNELDNTTLKYLKDKNSLYIKLCEFWPYYSQNNSKFPIEKEKLVKIVPKLVLSGKLKFIILRYIIIYVFLMNYNNNYEYILCTDLKDIIFQRDPFNWNIPNGVVLFEESRTLMIKENQCNLFWMESINKKYSKKISSSYIINGGVVFCTILECKKFLELYIKIANESKVENPNDQSIINIITYYKNNNIDIFLYVNYLGPVRTMALERGQPLCTKNNYNYLNNSNVLVNKENVVLNIDGSIPHILHTNSISITDPVIKIIRSENSYR